MESTRRVRLEIYGKVQGVFYRASTRDKARQLGVAGWVRNRPNGSVEALAEGSEEAVEKLVKWCHDGPQHARVDRVEVTDESDSEQTLTGFEVRR